jgi:hypothetical protein
MRASDLPYFVQAQMDQIKAITTKDEDALRLLNDLVEAWVSLRRLLVEDNGIAPEVADATLVSTVAVFAACEQMVGDEA